MQSAFLKTITFTLFFSFIVSHPISAQADKVATGGNWTNTSTWGGDPIPADNEIIQIPIGVSVTIDNGDDITLNNAVLVIQGELVVGNAGFNYSSLTLNGALSGIVVEDGGLISDPSFFGAGNFVQVDGVNFWGGRLFNSFSGNPALNTNDFTSSGESAEPSNFSNPLPVKLIKFIASAEAGLVHLEWVTASEQNNKGFDIEKSYDGSSFQKIGFVEGQGTTSDLNTYSFQDFSTIDSYYRFKQIDYDGKFEYSPIRYVAHQTSSDKFEIYPNPTYGAIHIVGALTNYSLYDESGKLVLENVDTTSPQAQNEISEYLSIHGERGVFLLKTVLNGELKVTRIIKN